MSVVVTISRSLPDTSQDAQVGSSRAPVHEVPSPAALSPLHEQPDLDAEAENASSSLMVVNTRLALRMDQLPNAQVPQATDAVAGLASILSNLEEINTIVDLSPDVRIPGSQSEFDSLIDILILL